MCGIAGVLHWKQRSKSKVVQIIREEMKVVAQNGAKKSLDELVGDFWSQQAASNDGVEGDEEVQKYGDPFAGL